MELQQLIFHFKILPFSNNEYNGSTGISESLHYFGIALEWQKTNYVHEYTYGSSIQQPQ